MADSARPHRPVVRWAIVGAAGVAGAAFAAAPTGSGWVDALWCGGFAAVLGRCAGSGSSGGVLPAAAATALLARTSGALALAVAAVVLIGVATVQTRAPA